MLLLLLLLSLFPTVPKSLMIPSSLDSEICPIGHFPCGNLSVCLPQVLHCNGIQDCANGADEDNCVDINGWPKLLDVFLSSRGSRPKLEEEAGDCTLDVVPEKCQCSGKMINCSNQDLHMVPSASSNATTLNLQNNKIKSLSDHQFIRYQGLKNLLLQRNRIHAISSQAFSGLFTLKKLFLSHNRITALKPGVFKDLHKLEWLMLDNNKIAKITAGSFTGLQSLYFLYMLNNSISELPKNSICVEMPGLNWLDLEGNRIKTVRRSVFQQCITVLILHGNKIRKIQQGALSMLTKLVDLDISANQLQRLHPLLFSQLQELQMLNISFNPLKQIYENQFDSLTHLHSLSLEGLEIPNIQNRMFAKVVNLSHIYFKKFQYCSYAPHIRSCKPNTDGISSFENLLANIVLRVSVWVMACVTCFGNLFVICMRSFIVTENCCHVLSIKSLCCADCLMGFYLFLIGAYDLKYHGEYNKYAQAWMESSQCKMVGFLAMLSSEVSVMLLTYMTLEKFFCIVFPFSHHRVGKKQMLSTLTAIWILGFLISIIPFFSQEAFGNFYGRNGVCFPLQSEVTEKQAAREYSTSIFLGLNLLAFIIVVVSYTSMFYSIHKTGAKTVERSVLSREVAIAKRFFFIVFTDALCWIPIFLLKTISLMQMEVSGTVTSWVVIFILPINSALNPILYTLTTPSFLERLKQGLKRKQRQLESKMSFTLVSIHTNTTE
ncbi:relaxin receptor 1 [Microcaecilia unicolor]|uniref:Relaxin receptor 1-like n=1 Tax=Microcaecilia unicolor TaxID=1415580 RepID=A0A6P7YI73_9AMPH|nr:relaxin receptor 1-like [Microcaecilia unicolor]